MKKLINLSNYEGHIRDRFKGDYNNIRNFLKRNNMDGIELIQYGFWHKDDIPKELITGLHLRFYPIWYDFWKGNTEKLLKKMQSRENIEMLYGGKDRNCIIEHYKRELDVANEIGVEYVVLHVCHVDLLECYSYEFEYNDEEIVESYIELINEVFDNNKYKFKLLLENVWWPGLTFKSKDIMKKLLKEIKYDNVGFMLDTGHMINSNLDIKDSDEAIEYILDVIDDLGNIKEYIQGIHLNYSLSGEYVKGIISQNMSLDKYDYWKVYMDVYNHISKIDTHKPFENEGINRILEALPVKYLVYELLEDTLEELENNIKIQDKYIH